eukprot:7382212-Prymnesium_polylepis.2
MSAYGWFSKFGQRTSSTPSPHRLVSVTCISSPFLMYQPPPRPSANALVRAPPRPTGSYRTNCDG